MLRHSSGMQIGRYPCRKQSDKYFNSQLHRMQSIPVTYTRSRTALPAFGLDWQRDDKTAHSIILIVSKTSFLRMRSGSIEIEIRPASHRTAGSDHLFRWRSSHAHAVPNLGVPRRRRSDRSGGSHLHSRPLVRRFC